MSDRNEQFAISVSKVFSAWSKLRFSIPGISEEKLAAFWRSGVWWTFALLIFMGSLSPAAIILNGSPATVFLAVLIAVFFFAICVFIHEIGHAVAAWAVGWRVHLIVVGTWAYAPKRKKFIRISDHRHRKDISGWVHATPPPDSVWNKGVIPFTLGGAIGNLFLGVLSMLAATAIYKIDMRFFAVLMGLGGVSIIFAVANLIPTSRPGFWKSDGASLIGVFKGEELAIRDQQIARLFGMMYDGVPAEEWDVSVLNDLFDGSPSEREKTDPLLISYAFIVADLDMAKIILKRYLKANPDNSLEYQCNYAFLIAIVDRDALHASKILEKLPGKSAKKSFSFWRAQAVTAHLLENRDEAREAIQNARNVANKIGTQPDDDDELIFQAIEQGQDLPRLEPRRRLSAIDKALSEASAEKDTDI